MQMICRKSTLTRAAARGCLLLLLWSGLCHAKEQAQVTAGPAGASPQAAIAPMQLNRGLKILYAGRPGSDREKDFVSFLKKYFDTVQTGNLKTFKETDTQGFDVTLLDWDWNEFKGPRPQVSEGFSRPLITLGVPGGLISSQWRLKTGYL
jgi:hypothetical protein